MCGTEILAKSIDKSGTKTLCYSTAILFFLQKLPTSKPITSELNKQKVDNFWVS